MLGFLVGCGVNSEAEAKGEDAGGNIKWEK